MTFVRQSDSISVDKSDFVRPIYKLPAIIKRTEIINMKSILLILFFFQSVLTFSQIENQNNKYNYDKSCSDGDQQEINICFYKAIAKFSLTMEKKYNCITSYLDAQIKSNNDSETKALYAKMKSNLVSSQTTWKKLKDQNSDFYSRGKDNGTETPMLIGQSIVKDYKDRLVWLDNLIEEEGQGNENELLKCE